MQIMNGKELSDKIKKGLIDKVQTFPSKPGLAVIQIGHDPASDIYVKGKRKLAEEIGVQFFHFQYEEEVTTNEIVNKIKDLNRDIHVDGIIVQMPIPEHLNKDTIINSIDSEKDIDGLTDENVGRMLSGRKGLISCTPKGIIRLLDEYKVDYTSKHVVIIGRSILVGKPLSSLLLNKDATLTICHSKTKDLASYTRNADILIVATGHKNLITGDMVKDGVIVVDVGITRDDNKICGDVNYDEVSPKASLITPVPGGVGPMTKICLMENVIEAYELERLDN